MNQALTGKFISTVRKKQGLTQRQLAEALNISDKTVSKWETGNGFPEISLMLPPCQKLNITVNELLTGEYLSETAYQQKAEENMVNMIKEKQENAKKLKLTVISTISNFIAFYTIIMLIGLYEEVFSIQAKIILFSIAIVVFTMGIYVAMIQERTIGYYHCKQCDEYFVPSFWDYFWGMHTLTKRHLTCPKCQKKRWCTKVLSKKDEKDDTDFTIEK